MGISKRLKLIVSMVTDGNIVADIGTDHGYVPITLLREGKSPHAIGVDLSKGSLEKAVENAARAGVYILENDFVKDYLEKETGSSASVNADISERIQGRRILREDISGCLSERSIGYIDFRLADGLGAVKPGEADCLILSGMGGILMTKIFEAAPDVLRSAKEVIVSPHRDVELVSDFLQSLGFEADRKEEIVDKNKRYTVIRFQNRSDGRLY